MQRPLEPSAAAGDNQAEPSASPLSPPLTPWLQYAPPTPGASWLQLSVFSPSDYASPLASLAPSTAVHSIAGQSSLPTVSVPPVPALWVQSAASSLPRSHSALVASSARGAASSNTSSPVAAAVEAEQLSASLSAAEVMAHRRSDAQRRQRERAAIERLEALAPCGEQQQSEQTVSGSASEVRQQRKRRKLSVLEASAARIERLEQLLQEAEQSNKALSAEVNSMAERELKSLQWTDASQTLHSAGLLGERLARALMDTHTGRLLDATSSYFARTGFTPGGALQRIANCANPSLRTGRLQQLPLAEYPLVRSRRSLSGAHGETVQWVPLQSARQYPRTLQLLRELLAGERDSFRGAFRCRWADGYVYEIQSSFWAVDTESVRDEATGREWRRPATFGCASSLDDYFRAGEE